MARTKQKIIAKSKKYYSTKSKTITFNQSTKLVPSWVVGREVNLDTYYTKPDFAKYCFNVFKKILSKKRVNLNKYTFIEPSAGSGSFFKLFPKNRRIGIDVKKFDNEYIQTEFLSWNPGEEKKYVAIGNPPFGYRGWEALSFINAASKYCDYVGFILPKGFISESRGSPKYRVPNMKLIHSEDCPTGIFEEPNGSKFHVNTVWQIWERITPKNSSKQFKKHNFELNAGSKSTNGGWLTYKSDENLDLYTVDLRKERKCGDKLLDKYDFFLQRSFFKKPPKVVDSFEKVNYVSGYGFIIKKNKRKIKKILNQTNWYDHCTLTVHNVHHISMYHIRKALSEGGLKPTNEQKTINNWF